MDVLIKACLNGGRDPATHTAVPVTPAQLAAAARAAVDAGAGAVHIHPRGPDGKESGDPADIAAAISAVRDAVPGLPVGTTTGLWVYGSAAGRLEKVRSWQVKPDFVSVNWAEEGAVGLAEALLEMGVGVEAGLWNWQDAWTFAGAPLAFHCTRALIEVRERDGVPAVTQAQQMDDALETAGITIPRLHHGSRLETWSVLEAAFRLGRDVRIGLEDTTVLPDGSEARDNAQLVATAVAMARGAGLEPRGLAD